MRRAILLFLVSALLSVGTFYPKSEHLFDFHLVLPVGLYFIVAILLAFRPKVDRKDQLGFAGLAMLVWLVLFLLSYNVLFLFIVPVAGGVGAWLIFLLGKKRLQLPIHRPWPVIWAGVVAVLTGLGFMMLMKNQVSIGLKAGVLTGLWQLGVGWMLSKMVYQQPATEAALS